MDQETSTPWHRYADPERKKEFARLARVRPATPAGYFEAACLTFPDDCDDNLARNAAIEYPYDRVVIEEMARLAACEPEENLPSKAQQARDIYNLTKAANSIDDKLKAHKLYAEVMGFVQKAAAAPVGINFNNSRIMIMPPAPNSLDEWENGAIEQQARLVGNASR